MEEVTYYSDGTVWVTNQRVIFGEKTLPLAEIKSVQIVNTISYALVKQPK